MNDDGHVGVNPPQWTIRLLQSICPGHLFEEIEGDLIQKFQRDVRQFGVGKARRRFVWNALGFVRPGIVLRNKFSMNTNQVNMLLHHLKFSIRISANRWI
jgi:putative ABC transport system permease protein